MGVICQIIAIGAHFLDKSARVEWSVTIAGCCKTWGKKIQKIFGTCAGYVKQATLFFDITVIDRAG
jgi:hypothetical protein